MPGLLSPCQLCVYLNRICSSRWFAVVAGIFWLMGGADRLRRAFAEGTAGTAAIPHAVRYGILSGVFIAAYTLWDRIGVAQWLVPPILYDAGTAFTQLMLLSPFAWRRRGEIADEWRRHRRHAFIVAAISPVSYILVLTALSFTPVSYVAPTREASILIGAFFGVIPSCNQRYNNQSIIQGKAVRDRRRIESAASSSSWVFN